MMYCKCTFAILLISLSLCVAESKLKKWKNKISTLPKEWKILYNSKYLETLDIPKYPGSNLEVKSKIKQLWAKYYKCLEENFEKFSSNLISTEIFTPMILEGESIRMECKTCVSPSESDLGAVTWHLLNSFESPRTSPKLGVNHMGRIFQDPYDASLIILRAKGGNDGDGGLYACFHSGSMKSIHFVHVGGEDEPVVEVKPLTSPKGPYSKGIERDGSLAAFTEWGNWSPCSGSQHNITDKCKKAGKRKRFGACKITYSEDTKNIEETSTDAVEKMNVNNSQEIEEQTKDMPDSSLHPKNYLKLFGDKGLPCGSLLVSNYVHTILSLRPNEIETGFCKMECLEPKNSTNGEEKIPALYDKLEDIPEFTSTVERKTLHENAGGSITLICPSLQVEEPLAYWQIDNIKLYPENLNKTKGKMFIDIRNRLHISNLQLKDSNTYSCWRNGHLVATMKLKVRKKNNYNFNQYLAIVIMATIIASIVYVFFCVFIRTAKGGKIEIGPLKKIGAMKKTGAKKIKRIKERKGRYTILR